MTDITRSQVTDTMTFYAPVHEQETNHTLGQGTRNPTQSEISKIQQRVGAHGSARFGSGRIELQAGTMVIRDAGLWRVETVAKRRGGRIPGGDTYLGGGRREREERRTAAARCHDWQAWARGPTGQPWTPAGRESEAPNYADGTGLDAGGREDAVHARTAVVWRRPRSTPR
jgi:hypothetical protein